MAGISRYVHCKWLRHDPDFAAAFEDAHRLSAEIGVDELVRRGVEGWDEPVYQGGKLVGTVRRHSDKCLIEFLRGAKPERYRGNGTNVSIVSNRQSLTVGGGMVPVDPEANAREIAQIRAMLLGSTPAIQSGDNGNGHKPSNGDGH